MMKRILIAFLMLAALPLYAGDGSLTVTPAVVQLRGSFGQNTTQRLMITNGTSVPFDFELVAQDVIVQNGKRRFVAAGSIAGSIAATAVFSRTTVKVQPGETEAVDMTVSIPTGAQHRAVVAIFHSTNRFVQNNVPMSASIGTLLTFSIANDVTVATEPLAVTPQSAAANLSVSQKCVNRGSDPVVARGTAAVLDANGKLISRTNLDPRRMLPGEMTTLAGEFAADLAPGHYKVLVTYDFEGAKSVTTIGETDVL
jgi:hypothetical protein